MGIGGSKAVNPESLKVLLKMKHIYTVRALRKILKLILEVLCELPKKKKTNICSIFGETFLSICEI